MGLIALQPQRRNRNEKFLYFTNLQRWIELKELFTDEACKLYHINRTPLINNVLQVGISSMKTVYCGADKRSDSRADGGPASAALSLPLRLGCSDPSKQKDGKDALSNNFMQKPTHHIETQCPACDPLFQKISTNLKLAQQTQTSMKCKITGKVMNDKDPPMWIPTRKEELTEKQKEEQKRNSSIAQIVAEQMMQRGYLVSKSALEKLTEFEVDQKVLDEQNNKDKDKNFSVLSKKDDKGAIKVFKCPLTGNLVEKSKVRKVFFC